MNIIEEQIVKMLKMLNLKKDTIMTISLMLHGEDNGQEKFSEWLINLNPNMVTDKMAIEKAKEVTKEEQ